MNEKTVPTSGLATTSLVFGLIGALVGWCSLGLPSMIAILFGHLARPQTKTGERGGNGMAITGLILGYLVAIPVIIVAIIGVINQKGK